MYRYLVLALSAPAVALAAVSHNWKDYSNARFGYSLCFPADLLTAESEAPNGDGRRFTGKDGAVMLAYGSNNPLGASIAVTARQAGNRLTGTGGKITYEVVKPDWFVISGSSGGTSFYVKTLYSGGSFISFELTYPSRLVATYAPVATRLNHCFHG